MPFERIQQRLRALPEIARWPDLLDLVERAVHQEGRSVWDYPVLACRAVGGSEEAALPASAAVFCALASIHLVDDLLDEDPRGDYRRLGAGNAANLALALQAAGHRALEEAAVPATARSVLHAKLAQMALATAYGQSLDLREPADEAGYWQTVEAKTPPLFAAALAMGALLGGAPETAVAGLERLGALLGRWVQVSDDLSDAMATPAAADWRRPRGNLAMLYALTADHPQREEFRRLAGAVADPAALGAGQKILLASGAVSFCAYHLVELSRQARESLAAVALHDPQPLARLLALQAKPVAGLLAVVGVDLAELA
jgi:geranylgeranyl diphosphate synthase type I